MDNSQLKWRSDWREFIVSVGSDFDRGLTDRDVTDKYCGQRVSWSGKTIKKRLDDDPGVQMEMPGVTVKLADGRQALVDYLFIHLAADNIEAWREVDDGMIVRFETTVSKGIGPFPGIQWSDFDEKRGVILINAQNARLVGVGQ